MRNIWCWVLILVCNLVQLPVHGFNLDLSNYLRHSGQQGSMFGFSIALHRNTNTKARNWVIVGAPKLNSSVHTSVLEPGGVFRCDVLDDNRCVEVAFDSRGNQFNDRGEQIDTKSHQWLGATVSSGGVDGPIMACAPRYVFHTMQPSRVERIEPVGTCFTSKDFSTFTEYSPCRTNYWGYHRQGSCQAGFSGAITKNSDRLFIGAPGSWYWQGQVYSINTASQFPYKPPMYQEYGAGQMYMYDVTNPRHKVYATGESYSSDDDSYFGYSVTTGDFKGDGNEGVAVGMPRGSGLLGKVAIYSWNMVNQLNITGKQIGAYFGYSLCSVDVDGDKLDDLIIGAPMYTKQNNEGKYDVGRVYIILQGRTDKFATSVFRDGINSRGRFGLAVASLNDVNLDGFGDFAVGAPYDGPQNRGAIYIFYGSPTGPLAKHSQVIYAEDMDQPYPRTFGFSLAGGLDLDGNLYPDMAAGAYASDNIYVFKARPVAVVDASSKFSAGSKLISLDDKKCTKYTDGKTVTCTELTSCLKYNGLNLPEVVDFDVSWVLDAKNIKNPRMFFLMDEGKNIRNSTFRLERGKVLCRNETVYIKDGIRDKLTPLEVEMRYQLRGNRNRQQALSRKPRDVSQPVIDQNRETVQRDSINIQKNCGPDNVCIPNLRLEIETVEKFLLGSKEPLVVDVLITNHGEDAFEANFYMIMPADLNFKKIQQVGDARDTPITCTAPTPLTNYTLKCDIGNPLPANKFAKFKVVMMPSQKSGMSPSYDFFMEANSTNPEKDGSTFDNIIKKNIGIWVKTDLSIEGVSLPEFDHYKSSDYKSLENATTEDDLGPHVVHIYNVRNNGPSVIEEAEVNIFWPYETQGKDQLMYLLNVPETDGNIKCERNIYVNERNLILDEALAKKSYLESIGAVVKANGVTSQQHGVRIEHSQISTGGRVSSTTGTRVLTEEEKRKLEAEESVESTGDASLIHSERANAAAAAAASASASSASASASGSRSENVGGGGGGGGYTHHVSWNSSSTSDGIPLIHTSSRNRSITYDAYGKPHVVESSTEYYTGQGSVDTHYASNPSPSTLGGYTQESHRTSNVRQPHYSETNQNAHRSSQGGYSYDQSRGRYEANGPSRVYETNSRDFPATSTGLERAAQGGRGFQTGTLDLGTINNKDDEGGEAVTREHAIHPQSSSSSHYTQHNVHPAQSSGHRTGYTSTSYHSPVERHQSYSAGSHHKKEYPAHANNQFDDYDEAVYDDEDDGGHYIEHFPKNEDRNYQRLKRQTQPETDNKDLEKTVHCKATRCAMLRCVAGPLGSNDGAWIAIRTRLVAKTMEKLSHVATLNISTMAVAQVTRLPYIGTPKDKPIKSYEITYSAIPEPVEKSDVVPLWVVVLSACVGVIILLLLIFLLYKCGFFKRNRPSDSSERQPLNRNGNYHGDEHL